MSLLNQFQLVDDVKCWQCEEKCAEESIKTDRTMPKHTTLLLQRSSRWKQNWLPIDGVYKNQHKLLNGRRYSKLFFFFFLKAKLTHRKILQIIISYNAYKYKWIPNAMSQYNNSNYTNEKLWSWKFKKNRQVKQISTDGKI